MAIKQKNQTLAQSMNPSVTIQLTGGVLPRFLAHYSFTSNGVQNFSVTSVKSEAYKMPLTSAQVYLKQVQAHWPLAQIVG
ncbi:hypothetical protein [Vibrio tarriae]|uniref:hypothetical protein n=1 Tax=Vibrio tarriae TaxID=2014742 RepID=UPI000DE52F8B|nr:hypothetical protein [Vibrio tarriae]RBM54071.1 hypothetical protein DLR64_05530 [Vibrio tarriae]